VILCVCVFLTITVDTLHVYVTLLTCCNTSIITSALALFRLLEHAEDTEMSSSICQSVWHNIPDNSNLYLSRSNMNTKS